MERISKSVEYLNRCNDELALNDAQLSEEIGVRRQTISNVRTRNSDFSDQICIKIADLLNENRMEVIANVRRCAKSEPLQVREFWRLVYEDICSDGE